MFVVLCDVEYAFVFGFICLGWFYFQIKHFLSFTFDYSFLNVPRAYLVCCCASLFESIVANRRFIVSHPQGVRAGRSI
jgi:hypothetical protein